MAWIVKRKLKTSVKYYVQYKENGKNKTFGKYPTKKLANDARLECEIQLSQASQEQKKFITLSELWALYQERKLDVKASTLKRYNQQLHNWYQIIGDKHLDKITVDTVFEYIKKRKKQVKKKTINEELSLLRTLLKYAVRWDYVISNPFDKVDNLKVDDKKQMPVLTAGIIQAILRELGHETDEWFLDVFVTALYSGMRLGEIINLQWDNINFDNNVINIQESKTEPRTIPMHPRVKMILSEKKHKHAEFQYTDDYVFHSLKNEPLCEHPSAVRHKFRRTCEKIGHPEITQFHSTRHTFVTHFLKFTRDKELTGFISGHKSNAIDVYIHDVHAERKQKAMQDFEY